MTVGGVLLLAAAALIAAAWFLSARRGRSRREERAWLPPELLGARLRYAERLFRTDTPFPLIAKVDRVYERDGRLVLVELKTRRQRSTYFSDVIELSAQRLTLEGETGERVADEAFVLVQPPGGGCRALSVRLLAPAEVVRLAQRYSAILSGRVTPRGASRQELCAGCAFVGRCRHTAGRTAKRA